MTSQEHGLTESEYAILLSVNTSREYGAPGGGLPSTVSGELALRLAEKAYRRGFGQGATGMHEELGEPRCGARYLAEIEQWAGRAPGQQYGRGEPPPDPGHHG